MQFRFVCCFLLGLTAFLFIFISGCQPSYHLKFLIEDGASVQKGSSVYVDGRKAGHVESLSSIEDGTLAHAYFDRRALPSGKLQVGIEARVKDEGNIYIDTSQVKDDAPIIQPGTTVVVQKDHSAFNILKNYSWPFTIIAIFVGLILILLLFWIFKRLINIVLAFICLIAAGAISYFVSPAATPLVEQLMSLIESSHQIQIPDNQLLQNINIGMPKPSWIAFFVVWIFLYPLKQLLVGYSIKKLTGK